MKIYWSLKELPELAALSPEQQKQAWKECYKKYALKLWQSWVALALMVALMVIGINLLGGFLGGAIGGGLGAGIWSVTLTNVLRPHLKAYVEQNP